MIAYDKLNSLLYDFIMKDDKTCFDTYAVALSYSHDGKLFEHSIEVFEIDACEQSVCWFNDWWEGQPFITLIGWMNVNEAFNTGDYHVYVKEFRDAKEETT